MASMIFFGLLILLPMVILCYYEENQETIERNRQIDRLVKKSKRQAANPPRRSVSRYGLCGYVPPKGGREA